MDPRPHAAERPGHRRRVRQRLQEVPAHDPEGVELPTVGRVDHLRRRKARFRGRRESPDLGEPPALPFVERGCAAHFRSALHPGMAADGHEADLLPPHPAPGQADVDEGEQRLDTVRVLGQSHGPDEDPVPGLSDELLSAVTERSTIMELPAGEWLFHQGDVGDVMFVVLTGRVEVVIDHYEEDWSQLSWVRLRGRAGVVERDERALELLCAKYPQYRERPPLGPFVVVEIDDRQEWAAVL